MRTRLTVAAAAALLTCGPVSVAAQAPAPVAPAQAPAQPPAQAARPGPPPLTPEQQAERARIQEESRADHADMLKQLGITMLRPGRNARADQPNAANYDEALANPYPDLPDVLTLKNGRKVTTKAQWETRRKELIEDFEREVVGRVPTHVPKVTWTVEETVNTEVGGVPVVGRRVIGRPDNSAAPDIKVEMSLIVVTPAKANTPVPMMIMFRGGGLPGPPGSPPLDFFGRPIPPPGPGEDPPGTEQLIKAGWGYAYLNPSSVQADNGAGLTKGIIGLVNKGQRRKPEDWGSLRAWGWGASRALDFFETDPTIDAKRVGIDGVSRYGKAALVTMAFDPRFAVVLVASSGEGGAKLHRRNFGEAVENLTASGQYHWMAGNFLKYGAAEATFGSRNAGDIPVDAHMLIALCAPRATFISYGIPEKGDALWLDQQGSFMATIAAQPVFRLLGATDLGRSDDYKTEKMPPVNTLLGGTLAWRQHDGGHTDQPNWKYFIPWADKQLGRTPAPAARPSAAGQPVPETFGPADVPVPRRDANSRAAHEQLVAKAKQGRIDVYVLGDSIARRWGATDYPEFLAHWKQTFHGWNAADFGWGADRTQHVLWRIQNGELDGVDPKVIVLLAGTNNVGPTPGPDGKVADVVRGLRAIVDTCRAKAPRAVLVLTAIFPRNDDPALWAEIRAINAALAQMADGKAIRYLDVNDRLALADGTLRDGMTVDKLHPSLQGYQVWADGLKPILTEILGPPAATDLAPPATGNPGVS